MKTNVFVDRFFRINTWYAYYIRCANSSAGLASGWPLNVYELPDFSKSLVKRKIIAIFAPPMWYRIA